jgi:hypothetical protein
MMLSCSPRREDIEESPLFSLSPKNDNDRIYYIPSMDMEEQFKLSSRGLEDETPIPHHHLLCLLTSCPFSWSRRDKTPTRKDVLCWYSECRGPFFVVY